jgi:hypothetical protein
VIAEEAFRHLAHTSLFNALDNLSARRVSIEIIVPSSRIASCLSERNGVELVIAEMTANSVSFAIADDSEILVVPSEGVTKMYGIFSANQSFIESFAAYLCQIETISRQD